MSRPDGANQSDGRLVFADFEGFFIVKADSDADKASITDGSRCVSRRAELITNVHRHIVKEWVCELHVLRLGQFTCFFHVGI